MASIIILEDDEHLGPLLQMSLEQEGHDVRLCRNASTTFTAYNERKADLVLADILVREHGIPVPDGGIIAVSRMKGLKRPNGEPLRFVAMTGAHHKPGLECLLGAMSVVGAEIILRKPFSPDKLIETVDKVLAS